MLVVVTLHEATFQTVQAGYICSSIRGSYVFFLLSPVAAEYALS